MSTWQLYSTLSGAIQSASILLRPVGWTPPILHLSLWLSFWPQNHNSLDELKTHITTTGTHLNDRITTLEAEKAQLEATNTAASFPTRSSTTAPSTSTSTTTQDDPLLHARTRADLAHTLTQKTHLEARLRATTHDRDRLLSISKAQQQTLGALTAERDALARKVRDQASELRGKKDLLQQVQDEMLALEMELNSSNAARARLTKENKDLVERWMLRVAGEANAMNSRNERG